MSSILKRIEQISIEETISITRLEKVIGASKGVLSRALSKNTDIQSKWIESIVENYPRYSAEWLLTGKGPMLKETIDNACMPNNAIPLITEDVILKIKDSNFKIPNEDIKQQYVIPDFENVDFLTPIKGSSMYPKYSPGDLVACRILHNPKYIQWNKIYIIITKDQGVLYKRLLPSVLKDHYKLVSDNDEYPPFDIPIDEITNIALVIGAIRLE